MHVCVRACIYFQLDTFWQEFNSASFVWNLFSCRGRWLLHTLPWIGTSLPCWSPWAVLFLLSAEEWKNWPPLLYEQIPSTSNPVTSSLVWAQPELGLLAAQLVSRPLEPSVDSEDPWWTIKIFLHWLLGGPIKTVRPVQSCLCFQTQTVEESVDNFWGANYVWI